jgi:5-methylcytosine-specific restriction endonuclease McrA
MHQVLQLDIQGTPQAWITPENAATHYATGSVVWQLGDVPLTTLRGGWSVANGRQSTLEISAIIALRGQPKRNLNDIVPSFSKSALIRRDVNRCGYCNQVFKSCDLQVEHIFPQSRGGLTKWENTICACAYCNSKKRDRTPEEAGMELKFLPYSPSRAESFLLTGRHIRADVHDWLAAKLPKGSRLN